MSFFLGSWGISECGTNKITWTAKQFSGNLFCHVLRFIPHEQRTKDTHSLYLQCFHQRSFLKFSEKSYKFKFLLFTDTLNLNWCKSLRVWFGKLANYFMTVFIGNWIKIFCKVQWRKYDTIANIYLYVKCKRRAQATMRYQQILPQCIIGGCLVNAKLVLSTYKRNLFFPNTLTNRCTDGWTDTSLWGIRLLMSPIKDLYYTTLFLHHYLAYATLGVESMFGNLRLLQANILRSYSLT